MTEVTKRVSTKGTMRPSRVYRSAEDQWYRIDYSIIGRIYRWWTGNHRFIKERE